MAKAAEVNGYLKVATSALEPNPWNPNKMSGWLFEKLVKNIEHMHKQHPANAKSLPLPPVVVRPHPTDKGRFQIIDGFHRYKVHKQLKLSDIDVFVMDVDDATAKMLTANLNYLRGEKDPERYTGLISDLLNGGMPLVQLAELLPEDAVDIADLITTYGDGEAIRKLIEQQVETVLKGEGDGGLSDDSVFVEIKFHVSVAQAKIIKAEIARISSALDGRNIDGRALEFMAVQSSQTDLRDTAATPPPAPATTGKATAASKAKAKLAKLRGAS